MSTLSVPSVNLSTSQALQGKVDNRGIYHNLIMDGTKNQAANATAALTRAQYADWKERFFPKIEDLASMTTYANPELAQQETDKATQLTNSTFANVANSQARNVSRYGMTQTAEQQQATADALSLDRAAAVVDAANNTNIYLKDRDRAIVAGGAGGAA